MKESFDNMKMENLQQENDTDSLYRELEADTLARTIWGEARGEGETGMKAIACVIFNRLKISKRNGSYWWGNSMIQICQKPFQFSCWNKDDPNFPRISAVSEEDLQFATALRISRRALMEALPDITGGATHYHAAGVTPYWVRNEKPVAVIGRHVFYKL